MADKQRALPFLILRTVAALYLGTVTVQIYLAGLGIFAGRSFSTHATVGYALVILALGLLLISLLVRAPARIKWLTAAALVLTVVQPVFVFIRGSMPMLSAFHPLGAAMIFVLAVEIVREARPSRFPVI